jgi:hypothetical protein
MRQVVVVVVIIVVVVVCRVQQHNKAIIIIIIHVKRDTRPHREASSIFVVVVVGIIVVADIRTSSKRKFQPSWTRNYYDNNGKRRGKSYAKSKYPLPASADAAFEKFLKANADVANRTNPLCVL